MKYELFLLFCTIGLLVTVGCGAHIRHIRSAGVISPATSLDTPETYTSTPHSAPATRLERCFARTKKAAFDTVFVNTVSPTYDLATFSFLPGGFTFLFQTRPGIESKNRRLPSGSMLNATLHQSVVEWLFGRLTVEDPSDGSLQAMDIIAKKKLPLGWEKEGERTWVSDMIAARYVQPKEGKFDLSFVIARYEKELDIKPKAGSRLFTVQEVEHRGTSLILPPPHPIIQLLIPSLTGRVRFRATTIELSNPALFGRETYCFAAE